MPQSSRLTSASRTPVLALLGAFALFSACVPILGIDDPVQAENNACREFVCSDGACDYSDADFGAACNISMMCDGKGACKLATRSTCAMNEQCASNICIGTTCRLDTLGPCTDNQDCKSDFCYEDACRLTYGDPCTADAECVPGFCVDALCRLPDGSGCAVSSDCASNSCVNASCRYSDGATCTANSQCASDACGSNKTCLLSVDKLCSINAECASNFCLNNHCTAQSCAGLAANCGVNKTDYCCDSPEISGGTYNQSNDPAYPAALSSFRLDRFEVTVARFRRFVEAYPDSKPNTSSGQHGNIVGSAWLEAWDNKLPKTHDELAKNYFAQCGSNSTWSSTPGPKDTLPINCVDWYLAFAFCAWDGGFLPTEAEWNYAAAGGTEQREYPWSNPPGSLTIDETYANYDCNGAGAPATCSLDDILAVGSKSPKGNGRWGHADLGGSMAEWALDWYAMDYQYPCTDCAQLTPDLYRVLRGGAWYSYETELATSVRDYSSPDLMDANDLPANAIGIRCARPADIVKTFR